MEELCIEGLANHDDREPCVGAREGAGEASVAARAGQAIEPRNHRVRGADAVYEAGRQHRQRRYRESLAGPARSETQTSGSSLCKMFGCCTALSIFHREEVSRYGTQQEILRHGAPMNEEF